MPDDGETVVIDLSAVRTKEDLLFCFGEVFEFGGPNANYPAEEGSGWGMNWDALNDSFSCLESGGIWGTSRRFHFPLRVEIRNSANYEAADPEGWAILKEILGSTKALYKNHGMRFEYRRT